MHKKSHWDFYRSTVLPSIVPAFLMAVFLMAVQRYRPVTGLVEVAILEILGSMVFAGAFWLIGFNGKERAYFKEKIINRIFRRKG